MTFRSPCYRFLYYLIHRCLNVIYIIFLDNLEHKLRYVFFIKK